MNVTETTEQERLVKYLRQLADMIERRGAEKIYTSLKRDVTEIDPVKDKDGQLWAAYDSGKRVEIHFVWSFVNE